jgi:hypothetical protein
MGITRRLSTRIIEMTQAVKEIAAAAQPAAEHCGARELSRISDLGRTRGPALSESNALNEHGVAVIKSIAQELEARVASETRVNGVDAFAGDCAPSVPLVAYMSRLARYVNVWHGHAGGAESAGVRAAVMALIYLERLEKGGFAVTAVNVHRLAMVAFLLAVKFSEDSFIGGEWWAKVGGVPCSELKLLEARFCTLLNWKLSVSDSAYAAMLDLHQPPEF